MKEKVIYKRRMENNESKLDEASNLNYAIIGSDKLISFYDKRGTMTYWASFISPVFKNVVQKFRRLQNSKCILKDIESDESHFDTIATYTGTAIIFEYEIDGKPFTKRFQINKVVDCLGSMK